MLDDKLIAYGNSNHYPFHMPGHKRQACMGEDAYHMDITEIDGFDNLYEPEEDILEIMDKARDLYGSFKSYLLVNGSTVGNLVAIFSSTTQGGEIIIGRNSHKSVYHGAYLRQLKVSYTSPVISEEGMIIGTSVDEYRRVMEAHPKAQAIVVTSPTYEGRIEPLREVVEMAHERGMRVIVDAAHGAHLGFSEAFPESPIESGADFVIMSLHKTLPALTQTGLLHLNHSGKELQKEVDMYLSMFQTSSPSYVFMASICQCLKFLDQSKKAFNDYEWMLSRFYDEMENLSYIRVKKNPGDMGKIIIDTSKANLSGYEIQRILREEYEIELEMSSFYYALAMSSVMDSAEGFERLAYALIHIDESCTKRESALIDLQKLYITGEKACESHEISEKKIDVLKLEDAENMIAARMVSLYPPAIPLFVPGEIITKEKMDILKEAMQQGLNVTGLESAEGEVVLAVVN